MSVRKRMSMKSFVVWRNRKGHARFICNRWKLLIAIFGHHGLLLPQSFVVAVPTVSAVRRSYKIITFLIGRYCHIG